MLRPNNYQMKKQTKKTIFILITASLFFSSVTKVCADIFVPQPCNPEEMYFAAKEINPNNYKKIREVKSQFLVSEGYCVNTKEYCQKNRCDLTTKIKTVKALNSHPKSVAINFLTNSLILFLLFLINRINYKYVFKISSLLKISTITLLGYIADITVIFFIAPDLTRKFCWLSENPLCGNLWYKSSFEERIISPMGSIATIAGAGIILLLVSCFFYFFFSQEFTKRRLLYSLLFGLLSNPIWYFIAQLIFF